MDCKVDWFSFYIPLPSVLPHAGEESMAAIQATLVRTLGEFWQPVVGSERWKLNESGGINRWQALHEEPPIHILWGEVNPGINARLSGQACAYLRERHALENVIRRVHVTANRVDLAIDLDVPCGVMDWVVNRKKETVLSHSHIVSSDGETFYIGSRKSEFVCRVYRYNPPHPRSSFLRLEVECKGRAAKAAALRVATEGEVAACLAAHARYQWSRPEWKPQTAVTKLRVARVSDKAHRHELHWLTAQVLPALQRFHREGVLDVREWFDSQVAPSL